MRPQQLSAPCQKPISRFWAPSPLELMADWAAALELRFVEGDARLPPANAVREPAGLAVPAQLEMKAAVGCQIYNGMLTSLGMRPTRRLSCCRHQ